MRFWNAPQTTLWTPAILCGIPELGWTQLSCGTAGCCQINPILANISHTNTIQILISIPSYEIYQYEHSLFVL